MGGLLALLYVALLTCVLILEYSDYRSCASNTPPGMYIGIHWVEDPREGGGYHDI
jgi:hypothetical protein